MVACGWSHSLAVCAKTNDTSSLYAWGKGDSGQLGLGDRLDQLLPTEICLESELRSSDDAAIRTISSFQPGKILAIAAGYFHTGLIVKNPDSSGVPTRVYTWGWGEHGQLGHGGVDDEVLPRVVTALKTLHVTQMACGGAHSMVITRDSECYGFGNAEFGQLGFMKEDDVENESSNQGRLNSTNEELRIIFGSDKLCTHPTHVRIEGYKVIYVACGWWHTVAIVLNCTDSIFLLFQALPLYLL
jgi:alpha-tubulin suppressor-like RCC1 family protein